MYTSPYLCHFVGRSVFGKEQNYEACFRLFLRIIEEGKLRPPPAIPHDPRESVFPIEQVGVTLSRSNLSLSSNEKFISQVVCFCDIPIGDDLMIHVAKYSPFGIGFARDFLVRQGACPVFYVPRGAMVFDRDFPKRTELAVVFDRDCEQLTDMKVMARIDRSQFLVRRFFSFVKFFDHLLDDADDENYYMEREWRILGEAKFTLSDIARLVVPLAFVRQTRKALGGRVKIVNAPRLPGRPGFWSGFRRRLHASRKKSTR